MYFSTLTIFAIKISILQDTQVEFDDLLLKFEHLLVTFQLLQLVKYYVYELLQIWITKIMNNSKVHSMNKILNKNDAF